MCPQGLSCALLQGLPGDPGPRGPAGPPGLKGEKVRGQWGCSTLGLDPAPLFSGDAHRYLVDMTVALILRETAKKVSQGRLAALGTQETG